MRTLCLLLIGLVVAGTAGCQTLPEMPRFPWTKEMEKEKEKKKREYAKPARMVAIWTDTVRYTTGMQPTRGFGGRIYFYNDKGQAIPVKGQLAVYGYDDTDVDEESIPENRPPQKRFVFTSEQFTQHFSKTDLGASYSIWIPWDAAGGEKRSISLLPVFTTSEGEVVGGQQSVNVLPGKSKDEDLAKREKKGEFEGENVSYTMADGAAKPGAMKSVTIAVPKHGAITGTRPLATPYAPGQGAETMIHADRAPSAWQNQSQRLIPTNDQPVEAERSRQPGLESLQQRGRLPSVPPPTRFSLPRSRALGEPIGRLDHDRAPSRLGHGAPQFPLPSELPTARLPSVPESSSGGSESGY